MLNYVTQSYSEEAQRTTENNNIYRDSVQLSGSSVVLCVTYLKFPVFFIHTAMPPQDS